MPSFLRIMMAQTKAHGRHIVLWPLRGSGRMTVGLLAGSMAFVLMYSLPASLRIIAAFDAAALLYVGLFIAMTLIVTPDEAADLQRRREPNGAVVLVATLAFSLISLVSIPALQAGIVVSDHWLRVTHTAASLLALFLSWLLVNIFFSLQYMSLYYDDDNPDALGSAPILGFPERDVPDFWDFMYYSFTIAMCYQTSDVTINGARARRLTLLQAIFSFFYVLMIIGFVVNILGAAI